MSRTNLVGKNKTKRADCTILMQDTTLVLQMTAYRPYL
jgi:hypothetical protein